ncbi:hypothetical protein PIB30_088406, partial [Stylosanthes scabra]|nr:hypothetical protein [Stylosanthes scabra]
MEAWQQKEIGTLLRRDPSKPSSLVFAPALALVFTGLVAAAPPLHSPLRPPHPVQVDAFNHTNPSSLAHSPPLHQRRIPPPSTNPHSVITFPVSANPHSSLRRRSCCQRFHRRFLLVPPIAARRSPTVNFSQICAQVLLPQLLVPFS